MKRITLLFLSFFALLAINASAQTCGVPTGLNATPVYDFQATVNWTAVSGAQFYNIRYRKVGTIPFTTTSSTPNNRVLGGLTPGTQYEYEVQTKCASGTSAYSGLSTFTTTTGCNAPSGITVNHTVPYNFKSDIVWTAVGQALYYTVRYRLKVGPGPWITGTTSGNNKLLNTVQGTWYEFQVATNCPGGQSNYSTLDSFLTPCLYAAPFNTVGTYARTLSQTEGGFVEYSDTIGCRFLARLLDTVGGNAMGTTTVTQSVASSVFTSVDPNYIYGRRKTTIAPTSNGPGNLVLRFSQADFDDYNANNPTYLDLPTYGDTNHPFIPRIRIAKVVGASISYITPDSMRWNGTFNYWNVYFNQPQVAADYYFYTMPDCVGITVSGLNVSNILGSSFRANWTQLTTPTFGWYSLRYKPQSAINWIDGGTSAYTTATKLLIGLTPNTPYEVQIRFHCSSLSEGTWSSSVNFTTLNTCLTPASCTMSNILATSAKANWPASSGALFYTVRYRTTAGPGAWVTGTSNTTNKTLTGLTASTQYDVEVGTNCAGWLSPYTATVQFTTPSSRPGSPALAETEASQGFEVSPNPASSSLTISFNDDASAGYELNVYDMHGKIVSNARVQSQQGNNSFTLDISSLSKGMYTISLIGNSKPSFRSKFIKE